jgi:hypothetical protein
VPLALAVLGIIRQVSRNRSLGYLDPVPHLILSPHRYVTKANFSFHPTLQTESQTILVFGGIIITTPKISSGLSIGHPLSVLAAELTFTSLIIGRLLHHQHSLKGALGHSNGGRDNDNSDSYTSVVAMIIESASLNIVFQLLAAIFSLTKATLMIPVFNVNALGQTQVSSLLFMLPE